MNPQNDAAKEITALYRQCHSLRETARRLGISYQTVRRTIISEGEIPDGRATDIHAMTIAGMKVPEIAEALGITQKTVRVYLAYSKGRYAMTMPSENARRIRACRERKR